MTSFLASDLEAIIDGISCGAELDRVGAISSVISVMFERPQFRDAVWRFYLHWLPTYFENPEAPKSLDEGSEQ